MLGVGGTVRHAAAVTCGIAMVLALSAMPAWATFRGANGKIAFYANRGGDSTTQLYTVHRNGRGLRQLTHVAKGDFIFHEDWSPDGSLIAYEFDSAAAGNEIQLAHADGSGVVDLTGNRIRCETEPSFTPNGRHIVFVRSLCGKTRTSQIWSMDLQGSHRHKITDTPGVNALDPNVSPDGSMIAFTVVAVHGMLGGALYVVDRSGTHMRKIVPFSFDVGIKSDWAPNGNRIVFTEYLDSIYTNEPPGVTSRVATVLPDGSHLRELTHKTRTDFGNVAGSYSPDGRWILYRLDNFITDRYILYKMRPDGSHKTRIVRMTLKQRGQDWAAA